MAGTSIVAGAATSERNSATYMYLYQIKHLKRRESRKLIQMHNFIRVEFYANTWTVLVNSSFVMEGGS